LCSLGSQAPVFTFDTKLRGVPVSRDQVVSLFESTNSPHLAIPGKQAGPSQAFLLGIRTANGFSMFVYLYLPESADCAIYTSDQRITSAEEYRNAESDAIGFVESMGFILGNMNFRALSPADQDELIRTQPPFMKDPRLAVSHPAGKSERPSPTVLLGRILSSF
jgi:hypothetical protein